MASFVHDQPATRTVFGPGRLAEVGGEVERLGIRRPMVVNDHAATAPAERVVADLAERMGVALRWTEVAQHVPAPLAARARRAATEAAVDGVVCLGGGSSTGLAKAVALSNLVPVVAVPTTYAGSEQTPIYGITAAPDAGEFGHKETGRSAVVQPRTVVYDPVLTIGLPPAVTGPSAFNALAHAVEALYAPGHNPVTSALAMEGVRAINRSLPRVMADPADLDARSELLYGAFLSGVALGSTAAAFHHKICHVLGGMFGLVHADAHSVVLPHAIAFNAPALPAEMARLADALDAPGQDPAAALWDLAARSHVPLRLADLHGAHGPLRRDDLAEAARRATAEVTDNPRPFDEADVLRLLERAFDGQRPES